MALCHILTVVEKLGNKYIRKQSNTEKRNWTLIITISRKVLDD